MNRNTNTKRACSIGRRRHLAASLTFLLMLGPFSVSTLMAANKLSADLQALPPAASVDVIVQFTHPPSAADLTAANRAGGLLKRSFQSIHGALFTLRAGQLNALAANPNIAYISPDRKVTGSLEFAEPTVNANIALQYGWNGSGVGVAVIDSGIYNHPDLKHRVVYSESFVPGDSSTNDAYGHGTHVAGIVGGNGAMSTGPTTSTLSAGLRLRPISSTCALWTLTDKARTPRSSARSTGRSIERHMEIRVVNLSLGRTVHESYTLDPLCQEMEKAWQAGLVVVVAAGNNGRDNSMGTSGYSNHHLAGQ